MDIFRVVAYMDNQRDSLSYNPAYNTTYEYKIHK